MPCLICSVYLSVGSLSSNSATLRRYSIMSPVGLELDHDEHCCGRAAWEATFGSRFCKLISNLDWRDKIRDQETWHLAGVVASSINAIATAVNANASAPGSGRISVPLSCTSLHEAPALAIAVACSSLPMHSPIRTLQFSISILAHIYAFNPPPHTRRAAEGLQL